MPTLDERVALLEATVIALVASGGLAAPLPAGPFRGNQHTGGFPGTPNPATPDPTPEKWAAYEKLHGRAAMIKKRAEENRRRAQELGAATALQPTKEEALNDKAPVKDKHPPVKEQIKNWQRKDGKAPGHYGADAAAEGAEEFYNEDQPRAADGKFGESQEVPANEVKPGDRLNPSGTVRVHAVRENPTTGKVAIAYKERGSKAPGMQGHEPGETVRVWRG